MSDSEEDRQFRPNMVYRSLRSQSTKTLCQIKKKISTFEENVRSLRAMQPLQSQDSPLVTPVSTPHSNLPKRTPRRTKNHDLDGYEFDEMSNLLKTPDLTPTPKSTRRNNFRMSRLRSRLSLAFAPRSKSRPSLEDSPTGSRLAKEMSRCRIQHKPKTPGRVDKNSTFIRRLNLVKNKRTGNSPARANNSFDME